MHWKTITNKGDDTMYPETFGNQGNMGDPDGSTNEHFLPLIYTIALQDNHEEMLLFNDHAMAGSLTMTSVAFGLQA